jgi:Cd2+/Zn2+-exporting ATPase
MMNQDEQTATEFDVEGMDCAECARTIEANVSKMPGVSEAHVSFATGKLIVEGARSDVVAGDIERTIAGLGYRAARAGSKSSFLLHVEGMDCEDEARMIRRKLGSLRGLSHFDIDVIAQRVSVDYDPATASMQDVIKAIAETGMKASLETAKSSASEPWYRERRTLLLAASTLITALAFILGLLGVPEAAELSVYGLAIVVGGYYPARLGLAAIRTLTLNIYTLLIVAVAGAVALGLWEEAAVLVIVYSAGWLLEGYAVDKARAAVRALMELMPKEAVLRKGGVLVTLPAEEIRVDDVMVVRPGERIPLDGVVVSGASTVDQAPVTGESIPVAKNAGDEVFAGTINQRGSLDVRVTKLSQETTLAKTIRAVAEAQAKKSTYQRFGDTFGRYYTPAMFVLALVVMVVPSTLFGAEWSVWIERGLVVLVVSCSCGLALSVPTSVVAAISNAAGKGVLFKGGAFLEVAAGLQAIVFDKTGTLTIGRPQVTDVVPLNGAHPDQLLAIAASVESTSEHPLAEAVVRKAKEAGLDITHADEFQSLTGLGASAAVEGGRYRVGSKRLVEEQGIALDRAAGIVSELESEGKSVLMLTDERELLGVIAVADRLRPEAGDAVAALSKAGIGRQIMLTGDNEGTARAMALQAGMDEFRAELLPEGKIEAVRSLQRSHGSVAMVGDGINDAPAMAEADLGVAMGAAGTDIAIETGDLVLMADDLSRLPYALRLSRRAVNNMRQNVAASLLIVAFLVPAALTGLVGLVPGLLINEASALVVIANALRLLR